MGAGQPILSPIAHSDSYGEIDHLDHAFWMKICQLESHMVAVLPGDDPEAIVLDLVQPEPAGWRLGSFGWKARRDEAVRGERH